MKLYTYMIPFSGRMSVWTNANSEEEARAAILRGDWLDSFEESFESHPEKSVTLIREEELSDDYS